MRRSAIAALLFACGTAGVALAWTLAPSAGAQEGATGKAAAAATSAARGASPPRKPAPKLALALPPVRLDVIPAGVTVGSVLVGGLSSSEAAQVLRAEFQRPLTLLSGRSSLTVTPKELGAAPYVGRAVERARAARAGAILPLEVNAPQRRLERWAEQLGRELYRAPVDSRMLLRGLRPFATKAVPGRRLNERELVRQLAAALRLPERPPVPLPVEAVAPKVTPRTLGDVIVIRRDSNLLQLWRGAKLERQFRVATGQNNYPTPLGRFEIINKWRNPWWYPPRGSSWAAGKQPIPPGPGNPLGTRWMGISSPYVGIHGTPDAASIGYSVSHGCIRMLIPQVEWLFERIEVGTPVYIVAA